MKGRISFARRSLVVLLSGITLLAVIHLVLQYLNLNVYHQQQGAIYELSNRFDFDDENSVPTWVSQFLLLGIAAGAFLAAYLEQNRTMRRLWLLPAAVGLIFSIDEVATLHEFILQQLHVLFFKDAGATLVDNSWLIVLPFVAAAGIWLIWQMVKYIPKRTITILAAGAVLFVLGAAIVDMLTNTTTLNPFVGQGIMVLVEESLELIGTSVILYAIIDLIERSHGAKIKRALKELTK